MKLSVKDDIEFQSDRLEVNKNKVVINNTEVITNGDVQIVKEDVNESDHQQIKKKTNLKHFIRLGLEKIGFYLRSNHIILSKRHKLIKIANSIQDGLPLMKQRPISKSKHVMFIDQLSSNWSLELIHTIQVNNRYSTTDDPRDKIVTSQSIINYKPSSVNNDHISKLIPKFKLKLSSNEVNLIKNGICLNSVEVYNHYSIRGTILTFNQAIEPIDFSKKSPKHTDPLSLNSFLAQFKKNMFMESKKTQGSNTKLDLVYIIWSIDEWQTWKSQVAIQKACKAGSSEDDVIKTHEFFLQNVDELLNRSERLLQLVICHQVNDKIFYDTNNEKCYSFEFESSI